MTTPPGTPFTGSVRSAVRDLAAADRLPAYLYDLDHLAAHVAQIRSSTTGLELLYAVKANPDPRMLAVVARHTDGLEISSGGELAHVRRYAPEAALAFGGPGKTDAELAAALRAGVARFHVESRYELTRLAVAAQRAGTTAQVLLRVNLPSGTPGVLTMGGGPSPFGMDPAEADSCAAGLPGVTIVGVHAHLASGLDADAAAKQGAAVVNWAREYGRRHRIPVREVNVGGGMAVDYLRPDLVFDWAGYTERLLATAQGMVLRIEPGRALTAYSGWYATRILDLKRSHGEWFAICAGGTHHLRTPVAKGHDQPLAVLPMSAGEAVTDAPVTFAGQLCTPKDVFARKVSAGRVRVGDLVVFGMAGAYAHNISHRDFLMHPPPGVIHLGTAPLRRIDAELTR